MAEEPLSSALDAPTLLPDSPNAEDTTCAVQFGDYDLIGEIARGGVGVVYKARQRSLDRIVAVKLLLSGQHASEDELKRFQVEAEAAAKLSHPSIVPIIEVGNHQQHRYMVMAYVPGPSLAQRLVPGPLDPQEAAKLIVPVAEGLEYAHRQGIIHRDLKPANILLDAEGRPSITDFGLAKRVSGEEDVTMTGAVLGTPNYMSPEQAEGKNNDVGPASDIYSLGALLYTLLTGRPPFQAATSFDTVLQVLEQQPVPPRSLNMGIPRDLETITMKCLEKLPQKRYAAAQDLVDDLNRFLNGEIIRARPPGLLALAWSWCRKHLFVASVSGLGAAMLTLTAIAAAAGYYGEAIHRRQLEDDNHKLKRELNDVRSTLRNLLQKRPDELRRESD